MRPARADELCFVMCSNEDGSFITITPIAYFQQEGCCYDGNLELDHLLPDKVDPNELMEGCFEYLGNPIEIRRAMVNRGFVEDPAFIDYIKNGDFGYDEIAYAMPIGAPAQGAKFSTEALRKHVVAAATNDINNIVNQFNGISVAEMLGHVSVEKNWRRISKRREGGNWERVFDCKPLEDQLRAYVITDATDTRIISITIQGE